MIVLTIRSHVRELLRFEEVLYIAMLFLAYQSFVFIRHRSVNILDINCH